MKKILFFIIFIVLFLKSYSQNLVLNASFEDTITCSFYSGLPSSPSLHWFSPTLGSPDYYSSIYDSSCGFTTIPNNIFGYQYPFNGNAFQGILIFTPTFLNHREYLEGLLSDSLKTGHTYCVTFYVSAANNCKFISDDIGIYFSNDSISDYNIHELLPYAPQINNLQGNILNDTAGWMLISGQFTSSGGEKYLTIGNFKNDLNTTIDSIAGALYDAAYYYIDDISVTDCTVGIEEIRSEINFKILPNPNNGIFHISYSIPKNNQGELEIFDIIGKRIYSQPLPQGSIEQQIILPEIAEGLYNCVMTSGNVRVSKKIAVIKE
jgi:OOP family OmpA-OmpF porin